MISEKKLRTIYVLSDFITANISIVLFNIFRYYTLHISRQGFHHLSDFLKDGKILAEQMIIPVVLLGLYWLSGYYNRPFGRSRLQEFFTTLLSALLSTLMIYLALLTNDQIALRMTNYEMIFVLFLLLFSLSYAGRSIITSRTLWMMRKRRWSISTVIIGASAAAHKLASKLKDTKSPLGYDVRCFVDLHENETKGNTPYEKIELDQLQEYCLDNNIRQLLIVPAKYDDKLVLRLLDNLFMLNIPVKIAPDTLSFVTSGIHLQDIYGEPFIDLTTPAMSESAKNVKRTLDVMLSSLALTLLSIPMVIVAIIVKTTSKGPVFYSQERIGFRQKPFMIHKFRTMRTDAEADGPRLSSVNDSRVTSCGRILRKYRIDELPQFWNVLKGEMSLVGPRPERAHFIRQIVKEAPYYTLIHQVRPGVTSWGMVKYGYASTISGMVERARYDLIYISNMSISVDFKIMIHTIKTVLTGRGM